MSVCNSGCQQSCPQRSPSPPEGCPSSCTATCNEVGDAPGEEPIRLGVFSHPAESDDRFRSIFLPGHSRPKTALLLRMSVRLPAGLFQPECSPVTLCRRLCSPVRLGLHFRAGSLVLFVSPTIQVQRNSAQLFAVPNAIPTLPPVAYTTLQVPLTTTTTPPLKVHILWDQESTNQQPLTTTPK